MLRSDPEVRRLKAPTKGFTDHKTSFPGLQLRHYSSGTKTWFIRARQRGAKGSPPWIGLGEFPATKFEEAQLECAKARASLRRGVDPRAEEEAKRAEREADEMTFGKASEEWIAVGLKRKNKPWRKTTAEKVGYVLLGGRLKSWRDRPIADIKNEDIETMLDDLHQNTQQTFLAPIRGLFKWAVQRGCVEKSPVAEITAPMPEGNAAPLIVFEEEGEPDLSELKAFLACLDALQQAHPLSPWPNLYRLGLLTGARYSEVVGLPWAELDLDRATWALPARRSKVKLECERPLSAAAVELLRSIPRKGDFVFPGKLAGRTLTKTGREPALLKTMLASHGFKAGFWYGRLRDSVASWLEFQNDAPERVMAVILNHKPPRDNTRRKHYALISGRAQARVLLERWAGLVQRVQDGAADNIIPFPMHAA